MKIELTFSAPAGGLKSNASAGDDQDQILIRLPKFDLSNSSEVNAEANYTLSIGGTARTAGNGYAVGSETPPLVILQRR